MEASSHQNQVLIYSLLYNIILDSSRLCLLLCDQNLAVPGSLPQVVRPWFSKVEDGELS